MQDAEAARWRAHFAARLEREQPRSIGEIVSMLQEDCRRHRREFPERGLPALVACLLAERAAQRVRAALRRCEQARERRDRRRRMLAEIAARLHLKPVVSDADRDEYRAHKEALVQASDRLLAAHRKLEEAVSAAMRLELDADDEAREFARGGEP